MSASLTETDNNQFLDLDAINARLRDASPSQIIQWAADTFSEGLIMTSSFGVQAAVMLHLVSRICPNIPVVAIDTGYLFPETYRFAEQLTKQLHLNVHWFVPRISAAHLEAIHGKLWEQEDPQAYQRYYELTKGQPMRQAIEQLKVRAWIAGLGAKQTRFRASLRPVELQDGIIKIHPILQWTSKEKYQYLKEHHLPEHPLHEKGYVSIGDVHSSRPLSAEDTSERDTRFHGLRQECGLHLPGDQAENDSRGSSGL